MRRRGPVLASESDAHPPPPTHTRALLHDNRSPCIAILGNHRRATRYFRAAFALLSRHLDAILRLLATLLLAARLLVAPDRGVAGGASLPVLVNRLRA